MKKTWGILSISILGIVLSTPNLATASGQVAQGVLVDGQLPSTFSDYVDKFYATTVPIIITIAVLIIIYSGVQYISSGVTGGDNKAAKERISGVIWGLIFFVLIKYIAKLLISNPMAGGVSGGTH